MAYTLANLANNTLFSVWVVVTMVLIWVIFGMTIGVLHKSPFSNPNDTQYANRFQAGPDGVSLNDRMVAAQAKGVAAWQASQGKVSTLTGSRDVPVFFQDYDYDMQVKGGNIYNQREGFGGPETDCGVPGAC
jgi:hypothetical protein